MIDFGDSVIVNDPYTVFEDSAGTLLYMAPEGFRQRYAWELKCCDVWSIGVITFVMLFGKPPFWGNNQSEIIEAIQTANFTTNQSNMNIISPSCQDFLLKLFIIDTSQRITAKEALNHEWITHEAAKHKHSLGINVCTCLCVCLYVLLCVCVCVFVCLCENKIRVRFF